MLGKHNTGKHHPTFYIFFLEEDNTEGTKEETASEGTEFTYSEDFEVTQFIIYPIKLSKPKMP